jgi:predicted Zn-dependent protease
VDNQKAAVQFIEPNGQAAVILTIESGTPDAALQALGAQDGVTVGGATGVDVNGLPGIRARFEAQAQDGRLGGEVLFVEHGGNTYRLLGLSSAANWGSFASAARGIQGSFQVERDRDILSRTVDRLDMVSLRQGLGFDAFRSRYPSTVDPVILALINQIDESATLRPGLWKRVVSGN